MLIFLVLKSNVPVQLYIVKNLTTCDFKNWTKWWLFLAASLPEKLSIFFPAHQTWFLSLSLSRKTKGLFKQGQSRVLLYTIKLRLHIEQINTQVMQRDHLCFYQPKKKKVREREEREHGAYVS